MVAVLVGSSRRECDSYHENVQNYLCEDIPLTNLVKPLQRINMKLSLISHKALILWLSYAYN